MLFSLRSVSSLHFGLFGQHFFRMKKAKKKANRPSRHFTFPIQKVGKSWMIDIPAKLSTRGVRERPRYKTKQDAEEAAKKLRAHALVDRASMQVVSPSLAGETLKANELLEAHGITLVRAADIYDQLTRKLSKYDTTIDQVVSDYITSMENAAASVTMICAINKYFKECGSVLKPTTTDSYELVLRKQFASLHESNMSLITTEQIRDILSKYKSPASMAALSSFWNWACEPARKYADIETLNILKPKKRRKVDQKVKSKIRTLSPAEVEALLFAAYKESKAVCMPLAIAIFAGVRMEELKQLKMHHITPDHIVIDAEIAKTSSARHTPISPTLRAWIDACDEKRDPSEKVIPDLWEAEYKRVRRLAGWDITATRLPAKLPKIIFGTWGKNCMRHTCATVAIKTGKQIRDLEFEFGHNEGSQMLKQHYVNNLYKKADAEKVLAVLPPKKISNKKSKIA